MAETFNAYEVFEMAEQIERNGARFYRRAAEIVSDTAVRDLLLSFAEMEDDHERIFAGMKTELAPEGEAAQMTAAYGDAVHYLRAFADGLLFDPTVDAADRLTPDVSPDEILLQAIAAEKDSIAIYVGIKNLIPDASGKDRIETIIREEMSHAALLSDQLVALRKRSA